MASSILSQSSESVSRTSSSLLERAKLRDTTAWIRLVSLYGPLIYHWCQSWGLQAADVENVGQEVFSAVTRKLPDYRHDRKGDSFRSWLRAITRNKLIDYLKTQKAVPKSPAGEKDYTNLDQLPFDNLTNLNKAENSIEIQLIYRQAMKLIRSEFSERDWQAFHQLVLEERHPIDVADELKASINTIYLAKSRILCRLRDEFSDLIDDLPK